MKVLEFRLLGSVDLQGPEGALLSVLAQPKRVALLAYLAIAGPNGYHRRDKLLGLFWAESDQEHGRAALRKTVYLLRQSLGEDAIVSRGDEEIGLAEGVLWCDAVAFEEALDAGEPEQALELCRGDLLEGFFISEAPEFERWLEAERERLKQLASDAAWVLAEQEEAEGSTVHAASWAKKAVSFSPHEEGGFRRLLELLDRVGDRAGAVKEYEAFAGRLREEYQAKPSAETEALIAAIRERDVLAAGGTPKHLVESASGVAPAAAPEAVAVAVAKEQHAERRPASLARVLAIYALVSLGVLVVVHVFTLQLGLPDWFFPSAVVVLLLYLPIIVATGLVQQAPISARAAGTEPKLTSAAARRRFTWRNAVAGCVIALAAWGVVATGWYVLQGGATGEPAGARKSVAVLPFINLGDPENETFSDGITFEIINRLSKIADLKVISRTSIMQYKGTTKNIRQIADELGVLALVEGEVQRVDDRVRISAQIIDSQTDEPVWSEQYDRVLTDVFDLQTDIAQRIASGLRATLMAGESGEIQPRPPDLEAYDCYVRAIQIRQRSELEEDVWLGLNALQRTVELDPDFTQAWALISVFHSTIYCFYWDRSEDRLTSTKDRSISSL